MKIVNIISKSIYNPLSGKKIKIKCMNTFDARGAGNKRVNNAVTDPLAQKGLRADSR